MTAVETFVYRCGCRVQFVPNNDVVTTSVIACSADCTRYRWLVRKAEHAGALVVAQTGPEL